MASQSTSTASTDSETANLTVVQGWSGEPWRPLQEPGETDDTSNLQQYVPRPVDEWCSCGKCMAWPQKEMNVCCKDHAVYAKVQAVEAVGCVTTADIIQALLHPGPLRVMYRNYCCHHATRYPDAETLAPSQTWPPERILQLKRKQQRLSSYRSLIFWIYDDIRKGERRPLPSCLYGLVRAMYPPTDDEEEYAEWNFSIFMPEAACADNDL